MSVDLTWLEQLTNARPFNLKLLRGEPFPGVSTDSRTVRSGELFVALRGDRFDGHQFVKQAFDRGAAAALVDVHWLDHNSRVFGNQPMVGVPDTLKALAELARSHRRNFDVPVIGVAGSNGKTTTKELIASVLSQRWRVLKTEGTLNNHIGVPLTLLRLEERHQAAVIELGMNHLGEVAALCEIAEPTHGLITNIGREHLEFLDTLENVARAEGELFDWLMQSDGAAFVNVDEPLIVARLRKLKRRWLYGFTVLDADVRGIDNGLDPTGQGQLSVECAAKKIAFDARVGLIGRHHLQNALAAAAVGLYFGIAPEQIQAALAAQQPAKHRMQVVQAGGVTLLDDTYNANPDSMLAALRTLAALPCQGRRIAALGNMGELGPRSQTFHREMGAEARRLKLDGLFTVGDLARGIHEAAALSLGAHCTDCAELLGELTAALRADDVLLLKASRSMQLDRVVEQLKLALGEPPALQASPNQLDTLL